MAINSNEHTREKVLFHHDEISNTLYIGIEDETWSVMFSRDVAVIYGLLSTKCYAPELAGGRTVSVIDAFQTFFLAIV